MRDFVIKNWEILAGIIGTAIAWFGGLKIKKQNERAQELENIKTVREMEKELIQGMKEQVEELRKNNEKLEAIIKEQNRTIRKYEQKFGEL